MQFGLPRKLKPEVFWKVLGLLAFGAYLWIHPPFLDWEGTVAYLAVTLGAGVLSEFAVAPVLKRLNPAQCDNRVPGTDRERPRIKPHQWRDTLLAVGEIGLCFVPLLLVGANPVTAEVAAVAVAALHFPHYPLKHCVWKGLHVFFIAIVVLPYGLVSVAIGHLIARAFAYRLRSLEFLQPLVAVGGGGCSNENAAAPEPAHPDAPR